MPSLSNSLSERDAAFQLHPNTDARRHEKIGPLVIERGEGIEVIDTQGKRYIEAMAGLWSVAVGFSEKRLVDAAVRQLNKLPFYHIFAHKSHEPSILLAEKLVNMSPVGLDHVFFCNSGSEAVDSAVKLAWYYNNALGRPNKKKFIARTGGFHGVTIAAASLTGLPANHRAFDLPLPFVRHVTTPHHYRFAHEGESEHAFADRLAAELDALIMEEGPENVAAFIGEPVIGSGGVLIPPATYWTKIQAVCKKHDVLLIADEVITGFGRLGVDFGSQIYDIQPDIMIVSKQITSSYQPLAAVLFSDVIYQKIADQSEQLGTFGHGFTGSGHPVAAAVALENIAIIEEHDLVQNAAVMGAYLQDSLRRFADHPLVGEVRGLGLVAAVELVLDRKSKLKFDPVGRAALFLSQRAQDYGLIVRPIGGSIAFCPPLIVTQSDIDEIVERFSRALDDTQQWVVDGYPAY